MGMEKWLADNAVDTLPVDDRIFKYDSAEQDEIRSARPWDRDPHYFKSCKISAAALLKMAIHAKSGGNIEVMGLMLGKVEGDCMIIQDCLALPVEGTETRVNASSQAYEYMSKFMEDIRNVDRLENAIGWYHSHPGYGCWLSGIDVSTQKLHQQYEEPFVAIVVDPVFENVPNGPQGVVSGEEATCPISCSQEIAALRTELQDLRRRLDAMTTARRQRKTS